MRSFWCLMLLLLLFRNSATAAVGGRDYVNFIAAIVNDTIITRLSVEEHIQKAVDILLRTYSREPEILRQKLDETYNEGLKLLLERELILEEFKEFGQPFPESLVEDEIKDRLRERKIDRITLIRGLQAQGVTYESHQKQVRDELVVGFMTQRNVHSAILISPAKIERYYEANFEKFKLDEEAKLRMIVLGQNAGRAGIDEMKQLAMEVLSKIKAGTSFAEMAGIHSEGDQRAQNGDWGWWEKSRLNPGLAEVAFSLQPGEVSGVIGLATSGSEGYWIYRYDDQGQVLAGRRFTSQDGFVEERKFDRQLASSELPVPPQEFYLMLVEDRRPARTKSLAEVSAEIEKDLIARERERLRQKWINRLKEKAFVRFF